MASLCLYGGDSRLNLELNLQDDSPWLRNWVSSMETVGHSVYVLGDSLFLDAMAGVRLHPTSRDCLSISNLETVDTKAKVGPSTGIASGLCRQIMQKLPDAILKGEVHSKIICIDKYVYLVKTHKYEPMVIIENKNLF